MINSLTTSIEVHNWVAHESKPSYKALLKAGAIQKQSRRPRVPEPWKGDPTLAQGETLGKRNALFYSLGAMAL